jgi:hypothetical protein
MGLNHSIYIDDSRPIEYSVSTLPLAGSPRTESKCRRTPSGGWFVSPDSEPVTPSLSEERANNGTGRGKQTGDALNGIY